MSTTSRMLFFDGSIIGRRSEQQDAKTNVKLDGGYHLCVLADGMGGRAGGQTASKTICLAFRQHFYANPVAANPQDSLWQALNHANQSLADLITQTPELEGMGATVIGLLIHEPSGRFNFISVGDSPLYHWREGFLFRLNANHSYHEELKRQVASGVISAAEAESHPKRHVVTSALTGRNISLVDQKDGLLRPGEFLILASDGIQTLDDQPDGHIARIIGSDLEAEKKFAQLLKEVEKADDPYQDNATVIMLGLTEGSAPSALKPAPTRRMEGASLKKRIGLWAAAIALLALSGGWLYFKPPAVESGSAAEADGESGPAAAQSEPSASEGAAGQPEEPAALEDRPDHTQPPEDQGPEPSAETPGDAGAEPEAAAEPPKDESPEGPGQRQ